MKSRRTRYVELTPAQVAYANKIGLGRHTVAPAKKLVSQGDMARTDIVGAMAEVAVCVYYEEDIHQVAVYDSRPGCTPDVVHKGWKVSVKATERWGSVRLIVPEEDENDIYILASVKMEGVVGLRGWLTHQEILKYEPTWLDLGKPKSERRYRYVSVYDLRRCR